MALTEAMQIFEELGDSTGAAWALNQQADVAREQGDLPGARALYERALFAFRSAGARWGQARSLADLGIIACELGEHSSAFANFRESLEIFSTLEHRRGVARPGPNAIGFVHHPSLQSTLAPPCAIVMFAPNFLPF